MIVVVWAMQLLLVPAVSPLCIGVIRKIKARLQNRVGASVLQPYKDVWKLMHKDEVVSSDASWIFRAAPFVVFAITVVVGASVPLFASYLAHTVTSDLLMIVYALAVGTFFLALAGMDTGSAFGGFGASREMAVSALAEGGFIFSLLTVALITGTSDVFAMSAAPGVALSRYLLPLVLAGGGFFIVLLAETARFPFDNPATHLELTMIHEAMILEYAGKRLALMEWAAANKLVIFIALFVNLFFPFGIASHAGAGALLLGLLALFIKIGIVCIIIAVLESSIAKYRFFRLPDVLMVSFILNAIAIGFVI